MMAHGLQYVRASSPASTACVPIGDGTAPDLSMSLLHAAPHFSLLFWHVQTANNKKKTHCHAPRQCTPQMQSFSNLLDRSIGRSPDPKACWLYVVVLTVAAIGR
jgi:hypothetical protein